MTMNPIHVAIYYWSGQFPKREQVVVLDQSVEAIMFSGETFSKCFPATFEEARGEIEARFGAYTEGDGSFGFSGESGDGKMWTVSGTIFESATQVGCVDVWFGNCSAEAVIGLLAAVNSDADSAVVQILEYGCFLTVASFCRLLG